MQTDGIADGADRPGPRTIDHFIGQRHAVAQARVMLEAAYATAGRLPHVLMCGPSGLGKTLLAQILAWEIGTEPRQALAQNLNADGNMAGFLLAARDRDVLFIDEIHELAPKAQTVLYRAMAEGLLFIAAGPFRNSPAVFQLPAFTLVGATTDEYRLLKPLRERFEQTLRFEFYAEDDLTAILERAARGRRWAVEPAVFAEVARRAKGVPRQALRLLDGCHRIAISEGATEVGVGQLSRACSLERVDSLGLDAVERAYLDLLDHATGHPVRPSVLANRLGLPMRTVIDITEEYVVRVGLVERTPVGRTLTPLGRAHIEAERRR